MFTRRRKRQQQVEDVQALLRHYGLRIAGLEFEVKLLQNRCARLTQAAQHGYDAAFPAPIGYDAGANDA